MPLIKITSPKLLVAWVTTKMTLLGIVAFYVIAIGFFLNGKNAKSELDFQPFEYDKPELVNAIDRTVKMARTNTKVTPELIKAVENMGEAYLAQLNMTDAQVDVVQSQQELINELEKALLFNPISWSAFGVLLLCMLLPIYKASAETRDRLLKNQANSEDVTNDDPKRDES